MVGKKKARVSLLNPPSTLLPTPARQSEGTGEEKKKKRRIEGLPRLRRIEMGREKERVNKLEVLYM